MEFRCPGTDSRFLKVEERKCPHCGYVVEIFSDEPKTQCPKCGCDVTREKTPSCIDWCKFAPQCLEKKGE